MISVSDAARFTQENIATRKFKPWWETVIDYVILALLLLTIFSWTKVISAESSGLICIPLNRNIDYSFNFAKYVNSRCAQDFDEKLLLYYPYVLFVLWLTFTLIQRFWLKIPAVRCKFKSLHQLFKEIILLISNSTCESKLEANTIQEYDLSSLTSSSEIKIMQKKILMLLRENSVMYKVYLSKTILLLTLTSGSAVYFIYWIQGQNLFKTDFICTLDPKYAFTPSTRFGCNLKPAQFVYIVILISICLQLVVSGLGLYALYWTLSKQWRRQSKKLIGTMAALFRSKPGFTDFQFSLSLLRCTIQEREAIENFMRLRENVGVEKQTKLERKYKAVMKEDFIHLKQITDYLGILINQTKYGHSKNHLISCLHQLVDKLPNESADTKLNKIMPLTNWKDKVDGVDHHCSKAFYTEELLERFCRIVNARIVVVHCYSPDHCKEIYEPEISNKREIRQYFITFTKPNFYHTTTYQNSNDVFEERRTDFVLNPQYREQLKKQVQMSTTKTLRAKKMKNNNCSEQTKIDRHRACTIRAANITKKTPFSDDQPYFSLDWQEGKDQCSKNIKKHVHFVDMDYAAVSSKEEKITVL